MKKLIILIPSLVATVGLPFSLSLVSCGQEEEQIPPTDPLCFSDVENDGQQAQISYSINGNPLDIKIKYKLDNGDGIDNEQWQDWQKGQKITLEDGQKLYVWNAKNTLSSLNSYFKFIMTGGDVRASGNVNSMINNSQLTEGCFNFMFSRCQTLLEPPELPAMELAPHCYQNMFNDCINLTEAPSLPAEYLADSCYLSMFNNCKEMKTAPVLNSTHLAPHCYEQMFEICGLTQLPLLPAENLVEDCYAFMFCHCPIKTIPDNILTSTHLADGCYRYMFSNCRDLQTTMSALPATILKRNCYDHMFAYCSQLTTCPRLQGQITPADDEEAKCYEKMFKDCEILKIQESTTNDNLICSFGNITNLSTYAAEMFGGETKRQEGFTDPDGNPTANFSYYWVA